jgi:hypothetical protein
LSQEKHFLNSIGTDKELQKKYKKEHKLREGAIKRRYRLEKAKLRKEISDKIAEEKHTMR